MKPILRELSKGVGRADYPHNLTMCRIADSAAKWMFLRHMPVLAALLRGTASDLYSVR
jgi:hypothetical protein